LKRRDDSKKVQTRAISTSMHNIQNRFIGATLFNVPHASRGT
jgi:ribosomal protein S2